MTLRLEPIVDGDNAAETIVFIQGWPDTAALWDDAVSALAPTYRCVRTTLPNYDGRRSARWGFTTLEIVDALTDFVRDAAKNGPVTLVLHDWGSYWGHPVHHRLPDDVARVVSIDVAAHFKPTLAGAVGIALYQSWLCSAFLVGGAVGDWMTRSFARLGKVPRPTEELTAWMNYPYRNSWADLATGRIEELTNGYAPTCPLLFIYGKRKPFHFHSRRWVDHVESVGGKVVGLPVDHWVMNDPTFVDVLAAWLEETRRPMDRRRAG